jgi:hypothetical protein
MANGFTYCWSDITTAKVYVGVHLGTPDDGYVCSSKTMLKEYSDRPHDFTREVLFEGDYAICAGFEKALISGLFKQNKDTFYNRSNGKKILFDAAIRKKMSEKATGRKMSAEAIEKMAQTKRSKPSHRKGIVLSAEICRKMSEALKGRTSPNKGKVFSLEQRQKMSDSAKKKAPISKEHRAKLSLAATASWAKRKQEKNLG